MGLKIGHQNQLNWQLYVQGSNQTPQTDIKSKQTKILLYSQLRLAIERSTVEKTFTVINWGQSPTLVSP